MGKLKGGLAAWVAARRKGKGAPASAAAINAGSHTAAPGPPVPMPNVMTPRTQGMDTATAKRHSNMANQVVAGHAIASPPRAGGGVRRKRKTLPKQATAPA